VSAEADLPVSLLFHHHNSVFSLLDRDIITAAIRAFIRSGLRQFLLQFVRPFESKLPQASNSLAVIAA
jgi:hypothetical protein